MLEFGVELESSIRTIGRVVVMALESLGSNSGTVKASEGFESAICLAISEAVLSGLVVVMMAPSDITERQTIGKKIELGERRRMTWPLRIPMLEREVATESTAFQRSEKVKWWPVAASMRAILPWWAREEMKVVTSMD